MNTLQSDRRLSESVWLLIAGSYTMWGNNKPNNYGGYQTCVVMHRGVGYKFDDDNCGQTAATYICELSNNTTLCIRP